MPFEAYAFLFGFWAFCLILTAVVAHYKKLGMGFFLFLAAITGPVGLLAALVSESRKDEPSPVRPFTDVRTEIAQLRTLLARCQERLAKLEAAIGQVERPAETASPAAQTTSEPVKSPEPPSQEIAPRPVVESPPPPPKRIDWELILGRHWLNKIGILVLGLGLVFLAGHSFHHFGPWPKIVAGYVVAGLFFWLGQRLEKNDKFRNYGRVLLGGGWALVYLTTFAMNHFDASRVLESRTADIILLGVVAAGMIRHALRYRSEELVCVAIGVAYLTSTIDRIMWFNAASCMILAATGLFLAHRLKWIKTLVLGILFTYGAGVVWGEGFASSQHRYALLTGYWGIFLVGIHLLRTPEDRKSEKVLSAANLANIALYGLLSAPSILALFPGRQVAFALGEGLLYLVLAFVCLRFGKRGLYVGDLIAGLFALTLAVHIEFLPTTTLVLWLIEIPFLLYAGLKFEDLIYRLSAYALTIATIVHFVCDIINDEIMYDTVIANLGMPWYGFISLLATVSFGAAFFMLRRGSLAGSLKAPEKPIDHAFSFFPATAFTLFLFSVVTEKYIPLVWDLEALALLFAGLWTGIVRFRRYAYALLAIAFISGTAIFDSELKTMPTLASIVALFPTAAFYFTIVFRRFRKTDESGEIENAAFFVIATILSYIGFFAIVPDELQPLYFIATGAAAILTWSRGGHVSQYFACNILFLTGGLVLSKNDYILSHNHSYAVILLSTFLPLASYYWAKILRKNRDEKDLHWKKNAVLFGVAAAILLGSEFSFIDDAWVSLAWGATGVAFILSGFLRREKTERTFGLVVIGVTLLRLFIHDLSGQPIVTKIVTFTAIGAALIGISYVYNRLTDKK